MKTAAVCLATMMVGAEAARTKSKTQVLGEQVAAFNLGMMKAMQGNPDDSTSLCYRSALTVNEEVQDVFDFSSYASGGFAISDFMERFNVLQIYLMDQYNACGVFEYRMKWDQICSSWPALGGATANLIT